MAQLIRRYPSVTVDVASIESDSLGSSVGMKREPGLLQRFAVLLTYIEVLVREG